MKQQSFENLYSEDWNLLDQILVELEAKPLVPSRKRPMNPQFPQLYRKVCHHLSLAMERGYSPALQDQLNDLVLRGHQQLYRRRAQFLQQLIQFVVWGFPNLVREKAVYVWIASGLLYLPGVLVFMFVLLQPELVYSVFDPAQIGEFEYMYDPSAEHVGRNRDASSDIQMFGFYIRNNIGVGFQTFASGIFFCVGAVFFLAYNGLIMGAVAGHLTNMEYTETFFPFVVGHGSFELTAITIAGAAGLMLGFALISPGRLTRLESLKRAASSAIKLIYGVIIMLLIAAFIEAFWSSISSFAPWIKYSVGAVLWAVVFAYLIFAGRTNGSTSD